MCFSDKQVAFTIETVAGLVQSEHVTELLINTFTTSYVQYNHNRVRREYASI